MIRRIVPPTVAFSSRVLIELHRADFELGHAVMTRAELAEALGLETTHPLESAIPLLVQAGMVRSIQGPDGGYALAQPLDEISLGEVWSVAHKYMPRQQGLPQMPRMEERLADMLSEWKLSEFL